jgi:hypothetical protein
MSIKRQIRNAGVAGAREIGLRSGALPKKATRAAPGSLRNSNLIFLLRQRRLTVAARP